MNQQFNQPTVQDSNFTPPSYKEMLQEAGKQLKTRKGLLIRRILLIIWPLLVFVVLVFVGNELLEAEILTKASAFIFLSPWIIFMILWGIIMRLIFSIEKRIWLDSYFDRKNLNPKASWHIAKKLFWPALKMRLQLFLRFYLFPFAIYIFSLILIVVLAIMDIKLPWMVFPIVLLGGPVLIWIYAYYLKVRLRFVWFLFLDLYEGETFSYRIFFQELNKLNEVSKSEVFKKTLIINIGADSIDMVIQSVIESLEKGLGRFGEVGGLFGSLGKVAGEEASRQAVSFGKIAAMYILYRFARSVLYKSPQKINEYIYKI